MSVFVDRLPMWLSFAVTVIGVVVSILLARLARGGVLYGFTILMIVGILIFGAHHAVELSVMTRQVILSEGFEAVSSAIFLAATVYLGIRLRKIIYGPR